MEIGLHDPADPEPGRANPGHANPGRANPGHANPGHANPGHANPGHANPGQPAGGSGPSAPSRFAITIQDDQAGTVVTVHGEIDLLSAPTLRAQLDALLSANPRHIAIDLTATTFMDSAGVHALLDASGRSGGRLAVICGSGPVRQVIELLGLTEVLNVVSSPDEYRARRART